MGIKIKYQQEGETFFKIQPTTKLGKVFRAYCDKHSINSGSIRFLLQGTRIQDKDTPESLEMTDGDGIQAMIEQQGGDGTPAPVPPPPVASAPVASASAPGAPANAPPNGAGASPNGTGVPPNGADAPTSAIDPAMAGASDAAGASKPAGPRSFNIKVVDQGQNEVYFKIKEHTPLRKVMDAYCERQGINRTDVRFLLDGERINNHDTPLSKDMEDGDTIEVVREQLGGGGGDDPVEELDMSRLSIQVKDDQTKEQTFRIKPTTRMEKVMAIYCAQYGRAANSLRFFTPDGKRITDQDTAATLVLEDGDLIDAHEEQRGGRDSPSDLTIKVVDQISQEVAFKMRSTTPMGKMMDAYCKYVIQRGGGAAQLTRRFFTYDGQRIQTQDTPRSLKLRDGDIVGVLTEVFSEKDGKAVDNKAEENLDAQRQRQEDEKKGHIRFCVKDILGEELWFSIKCAHPIAPVLNFYCRRYGEPNLVFWTTTGTLIRPTDTPLCLGLEYNGCIKSSYWSCKELDSDFDTLNIDIDMNAID